ncbi:hypothetical protein BDZ85DRAFT_133021 [Elsinoe ampelina]|uniref:Uncharacterized protein n=1 Tax=Elsinoe ampelina TaxID=302913 RepID=A0A6A6G7K7_9PEZI|nr:hypothetical protein BDZ85DRAFT_133021 [Elsinoe ampelina]
MDHYTLPSPERLREIAARQEEAEKQILERRRAERSTDHGAEGSEEAKSRNEQGDAARLIQRNYRGYKARREMRGHGLSPGVRWQEAVKTGTYDFPRALSGRTRS